MTPTSATPAHSFYLSSPLLGLARERLLAQQWISERQQACRHSYEHASEPTVASCQADVRQSDHYVLILAGRYGTPLTDYDHKSVTELEFEAALEAGCTLHAFVLNFSSDLANSVDDDPVLRERLRAFKERVQRHCRAQVCANEAQFADAIKLLAAAPPARPGQSSADPTLPDRSTPHNLPFRGHGGDGLIGRQQALERLELLLADGGGPVLITGMDGVGKTALALHHLRRRLKHYRGGVVMLDGQTGLEGLVAQLLVFVQAHFELTPPPGLPQAAWLGWLYSHWPGQGPALLFLDELQRPEDLRALAQGLPLRLQLLVTSRRQLGEVRRRVPLKPLHVEEAVELLEQLAERDAFSAADRWEAGAIARAVGGLPLALQLLGRQLARDPDLELTDLAEGLRQRGALAPELQTAGVIDLEVERGLQASFALVWVGLNGAERELAKLVGALPVAALPWELLAPCRPEQLTAESWQEARLGLAQQHLLERVAKGMVQAHPLLHDLFAQQAQVNAPEPRASRIAAALGPWLAGFSEVLEASSREHCERCLLLLEALAAGSERWPGLAPGLASLALGRVRTALGAYTQAQGALEEALRRSRTAGKPLLEAGALLALAGIARERRELKQAEVYCREALALLDNAAAKAERAEAWGLERAEALNGLGLVLHERGEAEAGTLLREALALRLAHGGERPRLVPISRNNLGRWLVQQKAYAEAERLFREALAELADELCEVAVALHNNLGSMAVKQGNWETALFELGQAVKLSTLVMGEQHPKRGQLLFNLAVLTELLGNSQDALIHYQLAHEIVSTSWGVEHPFCRECMCSISEISKQNMGASLG